jgi:hypothetical protein
MNTQIIQNNLLNENFNYTSNINSKTSLNENLNTKFYINTFVITLKDKQKYIQSDNYKSLKTITNKINISKGIILNEEQQNQYFFYAKSSIGILLAHLKLWKNIYKMYNKYTKYTKYTNSAESAEGTKLNNHNKNITFKNKFETHYALILEDDTCLNVNPITFYTELNNIINGNGSNKNPNISSNESNQSNSFDIYKLHTDFDNGFTSMAAYIININSIPKLLNNHKIILGQIDPDIYISHLLNKIKLKWSKYNIFKTNENFSLNRNGEIYKYLQHFNFKLSNRSDKTLEDCLRYKIFRCKNYEIIVFEIVLFFFLIMALIFQNKYIIFIIIILLIL